MIDSRGRIESAEGHFRRKIWILLGLIFCFGFYLGKITVKAEPASLESDSAVIYDQMNGENAVGNLVRGSNFELIGRETAEDGSSWYRVSAFGVEGYIKGDAQIGDVTEAPETDHGNAGQEGDSGVEAENASPGDVVETGNEGTEGTVETTGNAAQEGTAGTENASREEAAGTENAGQEGDTGAEIEEGESEETPSEQSDVYQGNNTREKTYAVGSSNLKMAGAEDQTGEDVNSRHSKTEERTRKRINTAFLFFLAVIIGSTIAALISYRKMKEMIKREKGMEADWYGIMKPVKSRKSVHKKKRHKKKKGKAKKNGNAKK